jgi:hypothetical protein
MKEEKDVDETVKWLDVNCGEFLINFSCSLRIFLKRKSFVIKNYKIINSHPLKVP